MEIKRLSDTLTGHGDFVLYGPSGAGKTYSISTMPVDKTIVLAVEKGLRTLADLAPDMAVVDINTIQDLRNAYDWLTTNDNEFEYIVIDSLSEMAEIALDEAKSSSKDGRKHYMEMADVVTKVIRSFERLPKTVIFIAQEERVNPEEVGILDYVYRPAIPGKAAAQKLPYRFDYVFCLRTRINDDGEVERRFQTGLHGDYLAKARTQRLDLFEEADWSNIFNKLK